MGQDRKILNRKARRFSAPVRACLKFAFAALFVLLTAMPFFAATLAEYRERVEKAVSLTEELLYLDEEKRELGEYPAYELETITEIRRFLPVSEKVEWEGNSIETDNQWLKDRLDEYSQKETLAEKKAVLTVIRERLAAVKQKIYEIETATVSERTKDEDKQKLAEILRREEYQKPKDEEKSLIARAIEAITDWLSKMFPRPKSVPSAPNVGTGSLSFVLQIILYALILGAIGFLIYRFAPFLLSRYRTREKKEKKERVILGEKLAADETSQSLFSDAERLARDGNLRQAIRKGYIALLCELSDRKIIGLAQNKTNRDYLRDVRNKKELHQNLSGLTTNFERHWYGFDAAETEDWEEFKSGYQKAVSNRH